MPNDRNKHDLSVRAHPVQEITNRTATRDVLANAEADIKRYGLDDYFIVDVDSHHTELDSWTSILSRIDDPVLRRDALEMSKTQPAVLSNSPQGLYYQDVAGRISHVLQTHWEDKSDEPDRPRDVVALERAMHSMGIDVQIVFPNTLLEFGLHPQVDVEVSMIKAYTQWMVEEVLPTSPRLKSLAALPFADPAACIEIVKKYADHPDIVGFMVSSQRHQGVQSPEYMPLYDLIQDTGLPIAFHAGPTWSDTYAKQLNKFISVHSISFVLCNIVHLTNWVYNGIPERFPNLNVIWIESGLAWIPFLMQRLDSEYLMRQSDAPLLTRLPSEYMREMFYTTQPMEANNLVALEHTMNMIDAKNSLLWSSDWPHWDFDTPGRVAGLSFLGEQTKRNILGENARRLFSL